MSIKGDVFLCKRFTAPGAKYLTAGLHPVAHHVRPNDDSQAARSLRLWARSRPVEPRALARCARLKGRDRLSVGAGRAAADGQNVQARHSADWVRIRL